MALVAPWKQIARPTGLDGLRLAHAQFSQAIDVAGLTRMDCLYGFAILRPELAARFSDDGIPEPANGVGA